MAPPRYGFSLAADPTHPDTLYLGTSDGITVSYNGGAYWYPLGPCAAGAQVQRMLFDSSLPPTLWAATTTGLWECRTQ